MLNSITIMGRLTAEPTLKTTQSGTSVVNITLACDRDYEKNETDFIECVAWKGTAEFISRNFHKGMLATAHGRLQSRPWEDKNGNKRLQWEVVLDAIYFGESKKSNKSADATFKDLDELDEELPF